MNIDILLKMKVLDLPKVRLVYDYLASLELRKQWGQVVNVFSLVSLESKKKSFMEFFKTYKKEMAEKYRDRRMTSVDYRILKSWSHVRDHLLLGLETPEEYWFLERPNPYWFFSVELSDKEIQDHASTQLMI